MKYLKPALAGVLLAFCSLSAAASPQTRVMSERIEEQREQRADAKTEAESGLDSVELDPNGGATCDCTKIIGACQASSNFDPKRYFAEPEASLTWRSSAQLCSKIDYRANDQHRLIVLNAGSTGTDHFSPGKNSNGQLSSVVLNSCQVCKERDNKNQTTIFDAIKGEWIGCATGTLGSSDASMRIMWSPKQGVMGDYQSGLSDSCELTDYKVSGKNLSVICQGGQSWALSTHGGHMTAVSSGGVTFDAVKGHRGSEAGQCLMKQKKEAERSSVKNSSARKSAPARPAAPSADCALLTAPGRTDFANDHPDEYEALVERCGGG